MKEVKKGIEIGQPEITTTPVYAAPHEDHPLKVKTEAEPEKMSVEVMDALVNAAGYLGLWQTRIYMMVGTVTASVRSMEMAQEFREKEASNDFMAILKKAAGNFYEPEKAAYADVKAAADSLRDYTEVMYGLAEEIKGMIEEVPDQKEIDERLDEFEEGAL